MNFLHHFATHHFGPALGIADIHVKEQLYNEMKASAGQTSLARLHLMQHCSRQPPGTNHTIGLSHMPD